MLTGDLLIKSMLIVMAANKTVRNACTMIPKTKPVDRRKVNKQWYKLDITMQTITLSTLAGMAWYVISWGGAVNTALANQQIINVKLSEERMEDREEANAANTEVLRAIDNLTKRIDSVLENKGRGK